MYICNCNGLNERQVDAAIGCGAKRWDDVHRHYGCKPQCGQCAQEIVTRMRTEQRGQSGHMPELAVASKA